MTAFANLKLLPSLQTTLAEQKISVPTEIQRTAMPLLMAGRSVVGISETGSGKTLAFALPILHLTKSLESQGDSVVAEGRPRAAVIVPSRELGEQVSRVFKMFTHSTRVRVRTVLGGTTMEVARRNVSGPFEVLVATPGRLIQLMDRKLVNLSDVRFLAFDEADQMLDQGFLQDAKRIINACPKERQLALFTATAPKPVVALIEELFSHAEFLKSHGSHRTVPTLTTINRKVKDGKRFPILEKILKEKVTGGTLLFTNTREQCDKLSEAMIAAGFPNAVYRGEMDKIERRSNLKAFRNGDIEFLISTDLAARGLDVDHVGRVINYHLPQQLENYIHRAGRTARAGRPGVVINLVTERDERLIAALEGVRSLAPSKK